MRFIFLALLCFFARPASANVVQQGNFWVLTGKSYTVAFNASNGAIVDVRQTGQTAPMLKSGAAGLWAVRLQDASEISASAFGIGVAGRSFMAQPDRPGNALRFVYTSNNLVVTVTVTGRDDSVDFSAQVAPRKGTVVEVALPARLRFAPSQVERFIAPMDSNQSVGAAFNREFFEPQKIAVAWTPQRYADVGYKMLAGGPLAAMRGATQTDVPTSKLTVTDAGKQWLGEALAKRIEGSKALVNRPPTREQASFVLVDSPDGPYLGAHVIGTGGFWQIGGFVGDGEAPLVQDMMTEVMNRLEENAPDKRRKIGVLSLENSPARGYWTTIALRDWLDRCRDTAGVHNGQVEVVSLTNAADISAALSGKEYILVLNPYGEWLPLLTNNGNDDDLKNTIAAIKAFATAGGHWIETGGYPFYYAMRPQHFVSYSVPYPPAFADFFHLASTGGAVSIYGVRAAPGAPWNKDAPFTPGQMGLGGDAISGYCDRSYGAFVPANQTWTTPITRLAFGRDAPADLAAYAKDNGLTRRLADKLPAPLLDTFKNAVMVKYDGSAKEKIAALDRLPVPSLLYFDDYLKGGAGKEYPDFLPPNATFGSATDLRAFLDRARQMGHLTMPYTNPTWWSDKPRGATFAQAGDAALLRGFDNKSVAEKLADFDGWAVSPWHPAVQAANRKTVKQFSEEFPADFLFRDQIGGRGWRHDLNTALPSPIAGSDGWLSQMNEDSRVRPLSTEAGWDRAAENSAQLCGLTLGLLSDDNVTGRTLLDEIYPPTTWSLFPLAQYLVHDRTAMLLHGQLQDVSNPRALAWALGMGFGLSYRASASALSAPALSGDAQREWLRWQDCLQKNVCSRYIGEPVREFTHRRIRLSDDGVIRAAYGPVKITANLNDQPQLDGDRTLTAYGFRASAPGMLAAMQKTVGGTDFGDDGVSFVAVNQNGKLHLWLYAVPEREVAIELPDALPTTAAQLTFEDGAKAAVSVQNGALRFRLPARAAQEPRIFPPPALANKAPKDWPGAKPAIGVLNLPGLDAVQTKILPEAWLYAFGASRLVKERGLSVKPLESVDALHAALKAGPAAWFCIVNPYGEVLPCAGAGKGKEMLAAVRNYVQNGGVWWETGGASFSLAAWPQGEKWQSAALTPADRSPIALPVGSGDDTKNTPPLRLTAAGREWLGAAMAARIEGRETSVCRSLPRSADDPGHVTLLTGDGRDFLGGYRLRGWGWLFRTGGVRPNAAVLLPTAIAATDYLYTHAPPPAHDGTRYLWHATL